MTEHSQWQAVIGLEIHMQLKTHSKLFSTASAAYGGVPNAQANSVDLALPGVLPVLNAEVISMAVAFGLSIEASIATRSVFARKNYFYPDLPKGYQISQYELPIVSEGRIDIRTEDTPHKTIRIERAHLEEDAGKLVHHYAGDMTGVDFNRSGVPLMEIVSYPDIRSAAQAVAYMKKIHSIGCYLGICDGNMQEGSLRCDANISIKRESERELGTRTEIKNLNSFRFIEKAIVYEINRQINLVEGGGQVVQETRLYDDHKDQTRVMRSKEDAHDYRYFPDPDLLPVEISTEFIENVRQSLPELQVERCARVIEEYAITEQDAEQLTTNKALVDYFEACCKTSEAPPQQIANWVNTHLLAFVNRDSLSIEESPIGAERLAGLLNRIHDNTISSRSAKQVFEAMWESSSSADTIIEEQGLQQMNDSGELQKIVDELIASSPKQVEQYRSGKTKVFGYFVGQVMKATQGRADPKQANDILKAKLDIS